MSLFLTLLIDTELLLSFPGEDKHVKKLVWNSRQIFGSNMNTNKS